MVLELLPLRGEDKFKPPPHKKILVPHRGYLFTVFDKYPRPWYMQFPSPTPDLDCLLADGILV